VQVKVDTELFVASLGYSLALSMKSFTPFDIRPDRRISRRLEMLVHELATGRRFFRLDKGTSVRALPSIRVQSF
jgi:hypothetical protein